MEKTFVISILYEKAIDVGTQHKLRIYFKKAESVDEATGKVFNHDISEDLQGFSISMWQAAECPEQDIEF